MPSYGRIRHNIDQLIAATDAEVAEQFANLWVSRLEVFETQIPQGRFEQVQWLRALGKISSDFGKPKSQKDVKARRQLRQLCRINMIAIYAGLPEAAISLRQLAHAAQVLVPRCASAHCIAQRLVESLGPRAIG